MAEKKFSGPIEGLEPSVLSEDWERAERFDKLRLGRLAVYHRDGFRVKAIPYARMERAFIRVQEVRGRMCYRLVLLAGGKEYADNMSEDEKAMDAALARLHELAPQVPVGYPGKSAAEAKQEGEEA